MNRESDNYISEHLFRYLLTEWEFDSQNSYKDIIEVINNKLYFLNNEIIITDGTGLSTYNLITPSTMNKVIEEIIKKISLEKTKSLLTTSSEKGIFYNRYNESNVWVKTGTLYTDSAIAGILESSNKNYYLFTIIINNSVENIKDIKDFEIELIKTIYYHIK
jgi:D-alanyl-D-alanine carboxypeptidase/D-alanyl-D-alanine-endopeptidase (penicillin-binding protein 4)